MKIRQCVKSDAKNICDIYNYYIKNTVITFEEQCLTEADIAQRIEAYCKNYPWLILENDQGDVVGYAYANRWSERSAYQKTVEITVYLHHEAVGLGYGSALYKKLLLALVDGGFHAAIAAIALPNEASVKLHEVLGFIKAAHFPQVGRKFERWVDVGYWQIML